VDINIWEKHVGSFFGIEMSIAKVTDSIGRLQGICSRYYKKKWVDRVFQRELFLCRPLLN
jgi:hypothetical protein